MKVCLLYNPQAGMAARMDIIRRRLEQNHRVHVIQARNLKELSEQLTQAAKGKFHVIAIAGGDGTLHAVINTFGPKFPRTPFAFLPLGTGNDFCRTLAIPLTPEFTTVLDRRARARAIDIVRVQGDHEKYMLNTATGGFSGRVAADVTHELKQAWGPLAYLRGAAGPIVSPVFYDLTMRYDQGPPESVTALNVVVANGRYAAGGLAVAPLANPEDGLLDVVVVKAGDFLDASAVAAALMAGDYLADDNVTHRRVKAVDIHSNPPMPYSIDGELVVASHLSFAVVPRAIRVYPGLDYRPDPKGQPVGPMSSRQALFQLIASLLRVLTRATRWPVMGLVLALVTLIGFTWLSFGVTAGEYVAWNREISQNLQQWNHHRLVSLSIAVTRLGDPGPATAITFIIALLYASWRQYRKAIGLVSLLLILGLTELLIKPWFAIPRPDWVTPKLMVSGFGYPSGHALRAGGLISFFILLFLSRRVRRPSLSLYSAALCLFAIGIALSRVHLGLHSATDVIAGLLLGTTLGSFAAVLVQPCKGD